MRDVTREFFRRTGDFDILSPLSSSLAARIVNRIAAIEQKHGPAAALEALGAFLEMLDLLDRELAASGPTH